MTGENKFNTETDDRLESFLLRVDEYLENKDLAAPVQLDNFREAESLSMDQLRELSQDECFNYALTLMSYLDHVASQKAKQQVVIDYCDYHIRRMVAREYHNLTDVYGPYELKEQMLIRENTVAVKLDQFREVAKARIASLTSKDFNLRKKIDLLNEKGKRL